MFCEDCGTKLKANAKFCEECGAKTEVKVKKGVNSQLIKESKKVSSVIRSIGSIIKWIYYISASIIVIGGISQLGNSVSITLLSLVGAAVTMGIGYVTEALIMWSALILDHLTEINSK